MLGEVVKMVPSLETLETAHAHLKLHLDNLADSEILLVSVSQYCRSSLM